MPIKPITEMTVRTIHRPGRQSLSMVDIQSNGWSLIIDLERLNKFREWHKGLENEYENKGKGAFDNERIQVGQKLAGWPHTRNFG